MIDTGLDHRKIENSTTGDAIMQCHIKEEGELAANRGKFCIKCTYLGTFPSSMTLRHVVIRPKNLEEKDGQTRVRRSVSA